jgi:hypothetical protein
MKNLEILRKEGKAVVIRGRNGLPEARRVYSARIGR